MGKKLTNTEWLRKVKLIHGTEYQFLDQYQGSKVKLRVRHNICGNEYKVTPNAFIQHRKCPYCYGNSRKTTKQYIAEIKSLWGDTYTILGAYINANTKIKVKHNTCGNVYEVLPNSLLKGHMCLKCSYVSRANKKRGTLQQLQKLLNTKYPNKYRVSGEYRGVHQAIKVIYLQCGHLNSTTPAVLLTGGNCPTCSSTSISKGEKYLIEVLKKLHIKYEYQKTFPGCKNKRKLRFDFWLPRYNACIEYDGIQHYEPRKIWGGETAFVQNKKRDNIKDNYCKQNNIKLIRIPYVVNTKESIEDYLLRELK